MAPVPGQMRLTAELVARVPVVPPTPDFGLPPQSEAENRGWVETILRERPPGGEVWLFAYGSLIWNPACAFLEHRVGTALGWHRSFCLGWTHVYRASPDRPGLMLALDRGGRCKGVLYRLTAEADLNLLVTREIRGDPSPNLPRWIEVGTAFGRVRALAFVINKASPLHIRGLPDETVADALATASGERGSMADYLYSTVRHLEERGIHDRHLWRLQEMVAARLDGTVPVGELPAEAYVGGAETAVT